MRPIKRGISPVTGNYNNYEDAKTELISRIGSGWIHNEHIASYCSYCERKIDTNLAVEHIEPKGGNYGKPQLSGTWSNFLLACVNCNSTKGSKEVIIDEILLPDRDNTFYAYEYKADGNIDPSINLSPLNKERAKNLLCLVGLDKKSRTTYDDNGNQIAQDRASQRIQVWGIAERALIKYNNNSNQIIKELIVENMLLSGFFSIWMTVFKNYPVMKKLFINSIRGTINSGCFDLSTLSDITPHPNLDNLTDGGKI